MKKETIVAIIMGLLLGGVVAFFLVTKTSEKELENSKAIAPTTTLNQEKAAVVTGYQTLEMSQPHDEEIVDKESISIAGKAEKDSLIVIQSPIKEVILNIRNNSFQTDFPLALGENTIKIVAYPHNQLLRSQEKELRVYYIEE